MSGAQELRAGNAGSRTPLARFREVGSERGKQPPIYEIARTMTNWIKRVKSKVIYAKYWNRALDFAAISRYQESFDCLQQCSKHFSGGPEFYALKVFVLANLGNHDKIIEISKNYCFESLPNRTNDQKYLTLYTLTLANASMDNLTEKSGRDFDYFSTVAVRDVHLPSVSTRLKRRFPMRDHPDWVEP